MYGVITIWLYPVVIDPVFNDFEKLLTKKTKWHVNPTGTFVIGAAQGEHWLVLGPSDPTPTQPFALDRLTSPVLGDADRLQQVIWNLLSNAIKFTPAGGRVEVKVERSASHVVLSVSDTGVGIAPEFLPHVFERFRQADSTTTRTHGGLGLGLAIVRHLVELHGGTVVAANRTEGGAVFTVTLPAAA